MPKIIHKKFESDLFTFKKVIANRESAQNWHFAGGDGGGVQKSFPRTEPKDAFQKSFSRKTLVDNV